MIEIPVDLLNSPTNNPYLFEEDGYDVVDHDDHEYLQFLTEDRIPQGIQEEDEREADASFVTQVTGYSESYRFENWPIDDLIAYVGSTYAKEAYNK